METSFDCVFCFPDTCNKTTSTCINTNGSYQCECKPGYGGDECKDIDECRDKNLCKNRGSCQNSDGSFQCLCPNGFTSMQGLICYSNNSHSLKLLSCQQFVTNLTIKSGLRFQCQIIPNKDTRLVECRNEVRITQSNVIQLER